MKKSTIWILGIVMGLSFLSLLYLQVSYIEEMVKMRREQFDESVRRSLDQACRNIELVETKKYLEDDVVATERAAQLYRQQAAKEGKDENELVAHTQHYAVSSDGLDGYSTFELKMKISTNRPANVPKAIISTGKNIPQTARALQEIIKERYVYQRALLDEVVYTILRTASDKPLKERVNFKQLDLFIKTELLNNGIDIPYHFTVTDREGTEAYHCPDYTNEGSESMYRKVIFQNDPPARMGMVNVHFPDLNSYIFSSVKFMIPSLIFTFVLLVTFIFTIYIIFRQKKLTEIKNDFINNMTHEFKTPISTISLAAQMLKDPAVGKSPAMFQHISGVINDETKRLRFQVEKVLQMSMFERQKATLKMKEVNANELIAGVVNTFTLKVEKYNGKITSSLDAENPDIFVDEMHFTNVIFNLLDNAVKYKKPEGELLLNIRTWNESGKLYISIQDNGIGIKKENLKGHAAICSKTAAERYGMKVLQEGIETNKHNFTRFLVVADPWQVDELRQHHVNATNKASMVFTLPHTEGSLSQVLSILSFYNINLTKIQSLPIIGREWEYQFYVDVAFNDYLRYKQSIAAITPLTKELKILGEYAEGRQSV